AVYIVGTTAERRPAELVNGDLKRDARPGRGLLEDHGENRALASFQPLRHMALALDLMGPIDDGAQSFGVQTINIEKALGDHGTVERKSGVGERATLQSDARCIELGASEIDFCLAHDQRRQETNEIVSGLSGV